MNRIRTFAATYGPVLALMFVLSGCAENSASEIRPLIGNVDNNYVVNSQAVGDVQGNLSTIAGIIAKSAQTRSFADVSLDDVNERVLDTTIVEPWRNVNEYAGGTEAAGWLASKNRGVLVSSSTNGTCWAVQMTGRPAAPEILYSAMFDPQCNAKKVAGNDKLAWTKDWPKEPTPNPSSVPSSAPSSGSGPAPRVTQTPGALEPGAPGQQWPSGEPAGTDAAAELAAG